MGNKSHVPNHQPLWVIMWVPSINSRRMCHHRSSRLTPAGMDGLGSAEPEILDRQMKIVRMHMNNYCYSVYIYIYTFDSTYDK